MRTSFFRGHETLHASILVQVALLMLSLGLWAPNAGATDGHQLIGIGAVQKGMGGAGVASPKDSTWTLLNPAGLVDLERRFDMSLEVFAPYRYIEPHGPLWLPFANLGAGRMTDDSIFYIPAMGAVFPKDNHAFGVGLFAVNGMGVDYRNSRTLLPRLLGFNFDRKTEYGVAKLALAYAYRFDNGWSVGAAVNLDYARFHTDMLTLRFWETSGDNKWDDALGGGFTLGIYRDWDRWRFGAAYTSPQWMQTFGGYEDLLPKPMDLPQTFQIGLAYDITPSVELAVDYKFIHWAGVAQIAEQPLEGGFGWKNQHVIKAGVNWKVNPKWTLRAGASYGKSPIDSEVVFANALFPAIVEAHATAGVSYALTKNADIHVAYKHAFGNKLTDSGNGDLFSFVGKGTEIYLEENSVTVEYSYRF